MAAVPTVISELQRRAIAELDLQGCWGFLTKSYLRVVVKAVCSELSQGIGEKVSNDKSIQHSNLSLWIPVSE